MSKRPVGPFHNEDLNPCLEESKLSLKCLEDKLYDYSKCTDYFDNYKTCKKFWGKISKSRKRAGISPIIPPKEERNKILELKEKGINVISAQD